MKSPEQCQQQQDKDAIRGGGPTGLRNDEGVAFTPESVVVDVASSQGKATGRLPPRLVSQHEAAAYLGISYWTLRDLVFRRDIPSVRIGRRLLLDLRDLDVFIAHSKTTSG